MPRGRRILLLADDSPTIQKVISLTFSDQGFEVVAVGDGEQALRRMEEGAPDIVLADAVMPVVNGYELCERIKQDARFRHIPVMLLVGTFEPFNEAEARRVGADTVLTKPFQSIRDLVNKVGTLLGGGETRHEDAAAPDSGTQGRAAADETLVREADVPVGRPAPEPTATAAVVMTARETGSAGQRADGLHEHPASFADIELDDQMIEARPAEAFGGGNLSRLRAESMGAESVGAESTHVEPEPYGADTFREDAVPGFLKMRADLLDEARASLIPAPAPREAHEAHAARPAFAARMADAAVADEALLDLGNVDPSSDPTSEADDFILDLADDLSSAHARAGAGGTETPFFDEPEFASAHDRPDTAGAFADASHGETTSADEPHPESEMALSQMGRAHEFIEPEVVSAEVPTPSEAEIEFTDGSVEGDIAKSPADVSDTTDDSDATDASDATGDSLATGDAGSMHEASAAAGAETSTEASAYDASARLVESGHRRGELSPEDVDAIARRVVKLMSEKVVRDIAWEVVPDLAELLIKKRLDEEKR